MRFVITGTNRGIGLEFVRQLALRGDVVEAGARNAAGAKELQALSAAHPSIVRVHSCDIEKDESVRQFAKSIGDVAVDVLINNAGVLGKMESFDELDLDDVKRTFDVDALGAIRVTRAMLPKLRQGNVRKILHISTGMASIGDNTSGGSYGYRMAKAALNMASKSMSVDFRKERMISVVVNPGWVQTDMGGRGAKTSVSDSVRGMLRLVDGLNFEQTGSFLNHTGETLEW